MGNIAKGFFWIFINFTLNLGPCSIQLFPDWLGYWYLLKGFTELAEESPYFSKLYPWGQAMMIYTGVTFITDLLGIRVEGFVGTLLGLAALGIALGIAYNVVQGIREMEERCHSDLNGRDLNKYWTLLAVTLLLSYLLGVLVNFLAILTMLISLVAAILLVVAMHRSRDLYQALPGK